MTIKPWLILCLLSCLFVHGCGNNIFQGLVEDDADSVDYLMEEASSPEDYQEVITLTEEIIESPTSSSEEKSEAHFTKAEAILGKNNQTPLDLFADITDAADSEDNPLSILSIDTDNDDLIEAAESIASANALGNSGTDDQNLLKGVVNTMVIVNTIDQVVDVDINGNITQKEDETYWDTVKKIMYPDPDNTEKTIVTYVSDAVEGFTDSNSFKDDQLEEIENTKNALEEVEELHTIVLSGGTYNGVTYSGIPVDGTPSEAELISIETQLETIFGDL